MNFGLFTRRSPRLHARPPANHAIGWLLRVLWEVALHPGGHPGFVPSWYPPLCLGFDVHVGVVLVVRFRRVAAVRA